MSIKNTLSFFLLLIPSFIFSQEFSIGIYSGLNASYQKYTSDIAGFSDDFVESKPGFIFGTSINCQLTDFFSLRTGFNFQQKGYKTEFNLTDVIGNPLDIFKINYNFNYFQIPVLAEASFLKDRIFFVNIGYGINFLNKARIKGNENIASVTGSNDISSLYYKNDHSFLAGLGTKISLNEDFIFVFEGRWDVGLTDIFKNNTVAVKNRSVFAVVSFRYKI